MDFNPKNFIVIVLSVTFLLAVSTIWSFWHFGSINFLASLKTKQLLLTPRPRPQQKNGSKQHHCSILLLLRSNDIIYT